MNPAKPDNHKPDAAQGPAFEVLEKMADELGRTGRSATLQKYTQQYEQGLAAYRQSNPGPAGTRQAEQVQRAVELAGEVVHVIHAARQNQNKRPR